MNENLENTLAEAIQKGISLAEKTGEFVVEQAPELIQQFLMFELFESIFWVACSVILTLVTYKLFKRGIDKDRFYNENEFNPLWFICYALYIPYFFIFAHNFLGFFKIVIAPKIYLIEYFIK